MERLLISPQNVCQMLFHFLLMSPKITFHTTIYAGILEHKELKDLKAFRAHLHNQN